MVLFLTSLTGGFLLTYVPALFAILSTLLSYSCSVIRLIFSALLSYNINNLVVINPVIVAIVLIIFREIFQLCIEIILITLDQ